MQNCVKTRKSKCLIKIVRILIAALLSAILLSTVGMMAYWGITGTGTIEPFLDDNGQVLEGSIAEKTYLDVNGSRNGMIIRGKDIGNPVLLFISGGPGVPQYFLNEYYDNKIEEYFTVCWWDYKGEGLSYSSSYTPEDITLSGLKDDAISVTKYLKDRFGKEKIYLMAHSGGTPLGIILAKENPEDYYAYFGMGQMVSEEVYGTREAAGYDFLKQIFLADGNDQALKEMNSLMDIREDGTVVPNEKCNGSRWEEILLKAGCATTREMRSDAFEIFFPNMACHCYTFMEKINYWRGKSLCQKSRYSNEYDAYLAAMGNNFDIPIFFLSGEYDYTCPVNLTQQYLDDITAPGKKMFILENTAHSPYIEKNDEFISILLKCSEA